MTHNYSLDLDNSVVGHFDCMTKLCRICSANNDIIGRN